MSSTVRSPVSSLKSTLFMFCMVIHLFIFFSNLFLSVTFAFFSTQFPKFLNTISTLALFHSSSINSMLSCSIEMHSFKFFLQRLMGLRKTTFPYLFSMETLEIFLSQLGVMDLRFSIEGRILKSPISGSSSSLANISIFPCFLAFSQSSLNSSILFFLEKLSFDFLEKRGSLQVSLGIMIFLYVLLLLKDFLSNSSPRE